MNDIINFDINRLSDIITGMLCGYGLYEERTKSCKDEVLILQEERKRLNEGFTREYLGHNVIIVSSEIKERLESNVLFNKLLTMALYEITVFLDKEIDKTGYIVEANIVQDYEYADWKDVVIIVKVLIKDPRRVVNLWYTVSENVWKKVKSIRENAEEIKKITENFRIAFEILE